MAANVLRSPRAVDLSVHVIRAFINLRDTMAVHRELTARLAELEHEEFTWRRDLTRRTQVRPALRPLLLISVEGA